MEECGFEIYSDPVVRVSGKFRAETPARVDKENPAVKMTPMTPASPAMALADVTNTPTGPPSAIPTFFMPATRKAAAAMSATTSESSVRESSVNGGELANEDSGLGSDLEVDLMLAPAPALAPAPTPVCASDLAASPWDISTDTVADASLANTQAANTAKVDPVEEAAHAARVRAAWMEALAPELPQTESFINEFSVSHMELTPEPHRAPARTQPPAAPTGTPVPAEVAHYKAQAAAHEATIATLRAQIADAEHRALSPFRALVAEEAVKAGTRPALHAAPPAALDWGDIDVDTSPKQVARVLQMMLECAREPAAAPTRPHLRSPSASPIAARSMVAAWSPEQVDSAAAPAADDSRTAALEAENRTLRSQLADLVAAVDALSGTPDPTHAIAQNYKLLANIQERETALARDTTESALSRDTAESLLLERGPAARNRSADTDDSLRRTQRMVDTVESSRAWAQLQLETAANLLDLSNRHKSLKIKHHKLRAVYAKLKATNAKQAAILSNLSHKLEEHEASIADITNL